MKLTGHRSSRRWPLADRVLLAIELTVLLVCLVFAWLAL